MIVGKSRKKPEPRTYARLVKAGQPVKRVDENGVEWEGTVIKPERIAWEKAPVGCAHVGWETPKRKAEWVPVEDLGMKYDDKGRVIWA